MSPRLSALQTRPRSTPSRRPQSRRTADPSPCSAPRQNRTLGTLPSVARCGSRWVSSWFAVRKPADSSERGRGFRKTRQMKVNNNLHHSGKWAANGEMAERVGKLVKRTLRPNPTLGVFNAKKSWACFSWSFLLWCAIGTAAVGTDRAGSRQLHGVGHAGYDLGPHHPLLCHHVPADALLLVDRPGHWVRWLWSFSSLCHSLYWGWNCDICLSLKNLSD